MSFKTFTMMSKDRENHLTVHLHLLYEKRRIRRGEGEEKEWGHQVDLVCSCRQQWWVDCCWWGWGRHSHQDITCICIHWMTPQELGVWSCGHVLAQGICSRQVHTGGLKLLILHTGKRHIVQVTAQFRFFQARKSWLPRGLYCAGSYMLPA